MITAICITYGRTKLLEQALAAFLSQEAPQETLCRFDLLVLNTFGKQRLVFDHPLVRIVNLKHRPVSLGMARNMAVADSEGDRIVIWDDDDYYLPHHLRTFADNWPEGLDWVWLDKRLCAHGSEIKEISFGCHGGCFGFTKRAWEAVGGYPGNLSVGEDRLLVTKITKLNGRRINLGDTVPPFISCWSNGAYHISGEGDDKPNAPTAYARAEAALMRRVAAGEERMGEIQLKPHCPIDWKAKAEAFVAAELKKKSMNSVCVVELGRYGDVINILPVLLHIHNQFDTPNLMVSQEFADLLDGVSYVKPHIVNLRNDQLDEAVKLAKKEYRRVICAQIWGGRQWPQERLCPTYNMESWRKCGFLDKFGDPHWRPLFDKRDREREGLLVNKVKTDKPMILVNLTHSVSSPFPEGALLLTAIQQNFKDYNVVNIGGLKLHRIYDLLGLMDAADCLVSIDSAQLHLATASDVPVVALVNNEPWLGTYPRSRRAVAFPYRFALEKPEFLMLSIRNQLGGTVSVARNNGTFMEPTKAPARRIFHCVEMHAEKNHAEANRKGIAQKSWQPLYDAGVIPCHLPESEYPRDATLIGEKRKLPFFLDVLNRGMEEATADDIIFFTNDDNFLHPELPDMLRYHVSLYDCACAQRCEFKRTPMPRPGSSPQEYANASNTHMGRDLFAFTKRWLVKHWDEIPDLILGCSDWDLCMAALVRNQFGIKTTRQNLEDVIHPAELPLGYVSHMYHFPKWNTPGYVNSSPGQIWNRTLFRDWAKINAPHLKFDSNLCV